MKPEYSTPDVQILSRCAVVRGSCQSATLDASCRTSVREGGSAAAVVLQGIMEREAVGDIVALLRSLTALDGVSADVCMESPFPVPETAVEQA